MSGIFSVVDLAQAGRTSELLERLREACFPAEEAAEALGWCCVMGNVEGTRELLSLGALPHSNEARFGTLHSIVSGAMLKEDRWLDCFELIVEKVNNIDIRDAMGMTAYLVAASINCFNAMILLEGRGADVHTSDDANQNALHWSLSKSYSEQVVDHLLSQGVRVNQVSKGGHSVLLFASRYNDPVLLEKLRSL